MTFGEMLKQILSVCGVRLTHFANALGYDASYVSRWISNASVPSLKNNSELFSSITAAILSCCNEKEKSLLIRRYCGQAPEQLFQTLEQLLSDAYHLGMKKAPDSSTAEMNAIYLGKENLKDGLGYFREAFLNAAKVSENGIVECICGTPLSVNGNIPAGFFDAVLQKDSDSKPFKIHIRQLIDMKDFMKNVDTCCAAICTFVKYDPDVFYTFYEYDNPSDTKHFESYLLINNTMLHISLHNPLTDTSNHVISFDAATNSKEYKLLRTRMEFMTKLLKKCKQDEMGDVSHFLYNYIMDGGTRYFLDTMQPIYMRKELLETIRDRFFPGEGADDFTFRYNAICANVQKEVIVYTSALLNYIYTGNIFLLGSSVTLSVEERIEHLEQLKENIHSGMCDLYILSDFNPLLNRDDTKVSFYLSHNSGFMSSIHQDDVPIMLFRSTRTVAHFNTFFSHFLSLEREYISHGETSLDYITRGIEILKSL